VGIVASRVNPYKILLLHFDLFCRTKCIQCSLNSKKVKNRVMKKVKELCKEFEFTAGMLKGSLAEGWKKK
jgi:hypothetical protein